MKKLNKSYLVAILVIIFIGIAGGFTKTVNHTSKSAGCEISDYMPEIPDDIEITDDMEIPDSWFEVNLDDMPLVCLSATGILEGEYGTRTVFDPKSTALFVIAGVIIALVGLEVRKKK